MNVVTAGSAGSVFTLGIIAARKGAYPLLGEVKYNSAELSSASTGAKDITGLNIALEAGLYYFAIKTNSTTNVTFRGVPLSAVRPCLYVPSSSSTEYITRLSVTQAYSPTFVDNQGSTNWINGAGYTPFLVLCKILKTTP